MNDKSRILIIDDDPLGAKLLSATLSDDPYQICIAGTGESGLQKLDREPFDLVLLDIMLPGLNGYEVCRKIKENPACQDIPILFFTAMTESKQIIKGFEVGAVDYIIKPFEKLEVKARVRTHLMLKSAKDQLRNQNLNLDEKVKERTTELTEVNNALQREIAARQQAYEELQASEAKNRAMLKAMPDHVIQLNRKGIVLDYAGTTESGFSNSSEIIGKKIDQVLTPDIASTAMDRIQATLQSGEIEICEYQIPTETDCHTYEFRSAKISESEVLVVNRDITEKKLAEKKLHQQAIRLHDENERLKSFMKDRYRFGNIIGKSQPMQAVYDRILKAAQADAGVIIYGESGTGKELMARAIHEVSNRRDHEFVPVNCGAIPASLLESELFGYKKGAFTGAAADKHGFFDLAEGGTLFLDEIGEIRLDMQVKLLRAIEGGGYTPVGSNRVQKTNVRIIAATNKNLRQLINEGTLREDFYYRIHIIPIHLPPLRERKEDLPLLIDHFMKNSVDDPKKIPPISGKIFDALNNYDWPGNVRELQNTLQRFVALRKLDIAEDRSFEPSKPVDITNDPAPQEISDYREAMESYEKKLIVQALHQNQWHREKAAASLGIPRRTFFRKLKNFELIQA